MRQETIICQVGNRKCEPTGTISSPIYLSTAYRHPEIGESTGFDYTRTVNPTRLILEKALAKLEGGCRALAFSSGMAAIHALGGLFQQGDRIIASIDLYGGTYRLFETTFRQAGIEVDYVDVRNADAVAEALTERTKAIFLETPSNPMMHVLDIAAIASVARSRHVLTIVDNTFLTPYFQRPLDLGADIVVHSATKYLAGHNDVLAGVVVCNDASLGEKLHTIQNTTGSVLGPFDSWLLLRGLKTLALRMERHQENARTITAFLSKHRLVERVFYPEQEPGGGMISFKVVDSRLVPFILKQLQVITFAESLGGVESLMTYPLTQTHADVPRDVLEQLGVTDQLLRLSVGIEHAADLIDDLSQAFDGAEQRVLAEGGWQR